MSKFEYNIKTSEDFLHLSLWHCLGKANSEQLLSMIDEMTSYCLKTDMAEVICECLALPEECYFNNCPNKKLIKKLPELDIIPDRIRVAFINRSNLMDEHLSLLTEKCKIKRNVTFCEDFDDAFEWLQIAEG